MPSGVGQGAKVVLANGVLTDQVFAQTNNSAISAYDNYYAFGSTATSISGIPYDTSISGVEGILSGNSSTLTASRTFIRTLDLVSEGPIEGPISGEYIFEGTKGRIGYDSYTFNSWGTAPESWLKSVSFNDVPIVGDGDLYNFQQVGVSFANGHPDGISESDTFLNADSSTQTQKTRAINERLLGPDIKADNSLQYYPKYFKFRNPNISRFDINIKIPSLSFTKYGDTFPKDQYGEIIGTSVAITTRYRPVYKNNEAGEWITFGQEIISGLVSSEYIYSIKLAPDYGHQSLLDSTLITGWEIELSRSTMDSIDLYVKNQTFVASISEVFQSSLTYPHSALFSSYFSAQYFSQVPNRSFDCKLQKVAIPLGYDPIMKEYGDGGCGEGCWGGDFQDEKQWTDNPAWIFYDLVTNKRYGLGKYIDEVVVDKWTLYEIAKYCDTMVDDEDGSVEPRFACNVLINSREEAFKVLKDFASVFRGIVYYGLGSIHAVQDRDKEPIIQFSNANVENGNFTYASSAKKTRYTVAVVRYVDKTNGFKPALEYVEDVDGIRKYGIRETEVAAFGCTSKGQAVRLGRWILATNQYEQETVNFKTGLEALSARPGDLIKITDKNRGLSLEGGRTIEIETTGVVLDRVIDFGENVYTLSLTTPGFFYDASLVTGLQSTDITGIRRTQIQSFDFITGDTANHPISNVVIGTGINGEISGSRIGFPSNKLDSINYNLTGGLLWSLDNNLYEPEYYTVIDIKEGENAQFDISALKHVTGKFQYIEEGITFTPRDPNVPGSTARPPSAVGITGVASYIKLNDNVTNSNSKEINYTIRKPSLDYIGTTASYAIFMKTGSQWDQTSTHPQTGDFQEDSTPLLPRNNLKISELSFLSNNDFVYGNIIPRHNDRDYYFLVYAKNSVGIYSTNYVTSPSTSVQGHYPIRDVSIHGLRMNSDTADNAAAAKGLFVIEPQSKNQYFTWEASFLAKKIPNIPIRYDVTIREPSPTNTPSNNIFMTYSERGRTFDFPFEKNVLSTDGPHRHYDIVVEAVDPVNGGKSTDSNSQGYDILEINNKRPSGYWLTPRSADGLNPGLCEPNHLVCTEQYITADNKIRLFLRGNALAGDLAGGYIYLSASGFSTGDFVGGVTGYPTDRGAGFPASEKGLREILKIPFDSNIDSGVRDHKISNPAYATPNLVDGYPQQFNFQDEYYAAVSFYDSFDEARALKGDVKWNTNQWVGFQRPFTGSNGEITGSDLKLLDNSDWLAETAQPAARKRIRDGVITHTYTGVTGCPIYPTRFWSANSANSFKYWLRINVNGMWEGNGIAMVRMLTRGDIAAYYNFMGFYEYSCNMIEAADQNGYIFPNRPMISQSMCRFTQGYKVGTKSQDFGNINVQTPNTAAAGGTNAPLTGRWVGVPLFWKNNVEKDFSYNYSDEAITSYNETGGVAVDGLNNSLNRPLHGFRRFRVYLDPNNLPPPSQAGGLASYSVIGMNAWNGYYESWNEDISAGSGINNDNLLFAREGGYIFPQGTVQQWMQNGDFFENIPGVWNHHPAGFGQGFGGLIKAQKFFDIHLGRLIDDSYLEEAFFGVVTTNDYSISEKKALTYGGQSIAYTMADTYTDVAYDDGPVPGYQWHN